MSDILDLEKKWYAVPLPVRVCSLKDIATNVTSKEQMDAYFQEAQAFLDEESRQGQLSRGRWYNAQFLSRGTTTDKVASAAVKLADTDFMFFLDGFNLLFDTARTDTHHYEAALKALSAVWPKLLPPRPLKRFVTQFFATLPTDERARKKVLVYWYLEDYLKRTYAQFLSLCEAMLKDRVSQRREAWLNVVGKLMCSIAEARNVCLAMMIDKLGDPAAQIAHRAYHHLLKLLSESSTHQGILFTELEKIIFMKNCPLRTMRYAVNILNQLVYSKDERKLALKSVQTYLALFRQLAVTGNVDSTVTTAILVGLRRAFPYAGTDIAPLEEHLNALFLVANTGNFQLRVATLSLLQLIAQGKSAPESFVTRWYRALYQLLLLSPKQIPQSTQLANFFTMLHRALLADRNEERVAAFAHRLLQRAVFFSDAMTCAVLLLVGAVAQSHALVRSLIRSPSSKVHEFLASPAAAANPVLRRARAANAASASAPRKGGAAQAADAEKDATARYDVRAREPQYAHASRECLWVLHLLTRHSHPSVVKLAVLLLFGEEIVFDVHPLDDMTPTNFLQMFVDAKEGGGGGAKSDDAAGKGGGNTTGMSVFRRAVHTPSIPSASDPYFVQASAEDVDVAALFLHRYAVQRQRFLDGLNQVRSTWGDAADDRAPLDPAALTQLDQALFGPDAAGKATAAAAPNNADDGGEAEAEVSDFEGDMMDVPGSDADLEWGSEDEAAYDGNDFSGGDDEDDDDELLSDDDSDGGNALSGRVADEVDDGEDFGAIIEQHKKEKTKKQKIAERWLDHRSAPITRDDGGRDRSSAKRRRFH